MKNVTTGLFTLFTEKTGGYYNDFYNSIGGRLFDTQAPDGAEFPFAVYFIVSDTQEDSFTEDIREVYLQFSLFSNASSSAEIKDMETYLATMLKDKVFTATGWTVITTRRIQGNGPYVMAADEASGTGRHWQYNIDFIVYVSKS